MKKGFLADNWTLILAFLLLFVVAAMILGKQNQTRKRAEIKDIRKKLGEDIGADGTDLKTITSGVRPEPGYNAQPYAKMVYEAKGLFNDDEEAVYRAFAGKTRPQVAAIYATFKSLYGLDLDAYLRSFMNTSEFEKVIQSAR